MAGVLLETKFHVPRAHGGRVARPRLTARLERGAQVTLTLVSAPAGFGKTTLLAELSEHGPDRRLAWLSLDPGDNDPTTFWTYVIGALERASPGVGAAGQSVIEAAHASVDAVLATLLNSLAHLPAPLVLVLDDFHVIEDPTIGEQVAYFVEHLPAQVHVVMGTRADPALPLARLRSNGALFEIRAADLRFSPDEAASYLTDVMRLSLTPRDVAVLEARTEGWIAALQLAGLSMQGREDVHAFIESFAGDDRYIVDYLVEEVLRRQTDAVRDFLLKTSILSRMTAALCEMVTGQEGGRASLDALDRGNLFLVPLDDQRRWYRYHHLFAGVLQAHLAAELPDEVGRLHRRASEWFERSGDVAEAIRHAFESGDMDRAADLVEVAMPEMRKHRREPALRRWLDAIPEDVVRRRPVLAVGFAGTMLSTGSIDGIDRLLTGAEQLLAGTGSVARAGMTVVDQAEFARLPGTIELYRAGLAKVRGDFDQHLVHARRVFEMTEEGDHIGRGGAAAFLGLAYWELGDVDAGYRFYTEGMASLEKAGYTTDLVGGSIVQADIRLVQGRLREAMRVYEHGLELGAAPGGGLRGTADMHTGIARLRYEQNNLAESRAHLAASRQLGEEHAFPRNPYRRRVVEARVLQAEGDLEAALAMLDEAEPMYLSEFSPDVHPTGAVRARMEIAHGRLTAARRWANELGLTTADEVTYVREFEHMTLVRLLAAEAAAGESADLPGGLELAERLRLAAERGDRSGSRIEIGIVQALAHDAAGDRAAALTALRGAMELAEPEGYVRVFLDEGPAMVGLLRSAAKERGAAYARVLIAAADGATTTPAPRQLLPEPLSERELEVLRLLRSELDGPAMARELYVSINTFRSHTKSIYAKLGVTSRRAAIKRAEELGLLTSTGSSRPAS